MIEQLFTDAERQLIIVWATSALVRIKNDPDMRDAQQKCVSILSKLYGTDTVIIARRAYPSLDLRKSDAEARMRADAAYRNPLFPERKCDYCGKPYRGPAVYCQLACAEADA